MSKVKGLLMLAVAVVLSLGFGLKADASSISTVTGLRQVDASSSSVDLEWNGLLNNGIRYEAAISQDGVNWVAKEHWSPSDNYIKISDLNAGSSYQVRVRAYAREWNDETNSYDKLYANYSAPIEVVTAPNQRPKNIKHTSSSETSVSATWDAVPGANSYIVKCKNERNTDSVKTVKVIAPKVTISKLSKNSTYRLEIYPIRVSTQTGYSTDDDWVTYSTIYSVGTTPTKLKAPTVSFYWQNSGQISVECQRTPNAKGYQYQLYTAVGKGSKVSTIENSIGYSTYIKSNKLKKHQAFKVRVRAYTTTTSGSKKYGSWSDWKYVAPQPDVISMKKVSKTGKLRVKWDTINGSSRYVLYGSTKKNSGYKKIVQTGKTYFDVSKVKGAKLKKNKTYYFRVVAQKKVGGKYISLAPGNDDYCWYVKYK